MPPPLPTFRVEESPLFVHKGVDFAGLLYMIMMKGDSTTRNVLISDPTFLLCLKRFTAHRGLPSKIISDNRKTLMAVMIESLVDDEDVH